MKEETRLKLKEAAQRRSEEARRARIRCQMISEKVRKENIERRKQTDEFKVICKDGPHKTDYTCLTEEIALEKVKEISGHFKTHFIPVIVEIKHCVGYSRKLIRKFEIRQGSITEIEI